MTIRQEPAGQFGEELKKVAAAQTVAKSAAVRDYAARVKVAVTTFEQSGDEDAFLMTMQRHNERAANEIGSVTSTGA